MDTFKEGDLVLFKTNRVWGLKILEVKRNYDNGNVGLIEHNGDSRVGLMANEKELVSINTYEGQHRLEVIEKIKALQFQIDSYMDSLFV